VLGASGRAAVDFPAKIRNNPARAAALAGGAAFLALKGPSRLFRTARRAVGGARSPMPAGLLPEEIERTLSSLGDDGVRVRAVLERDFDAYVKTSRKRRHDVRRLLILSVAQPLLVRGSRALAGRLFAPDEATFRDRMGSALNGSIPTGAGVSTQGTDTAGDDSAGTGRDGSG
jgi:hypothetical protein